jgi:hypothetical protein
LAHEAAHALADHHDLESDEDLEAVAEACAYLTCRALGLDTRSRSLWSLRGYGVDAEMLEDLAPRIERITSRLITWCLDDQEQLFATRAMEDRPARRSGTILN